MKRRKFLKLLATSSIVSSGATVTGCKSSNSSKNKTSPKNNQNAGLPDNRPNILFIYTDDQRYDSLGFMGNTDVRTPHFDALAAKSTVFENAFVVTSICAISRASSFTSLYASREGVYDFKTALRDSDLQNSYAGILQKNGYYTGFIGKYGIGHSIHNTNKGSRVFDYWGGFPYQGSYFHEIDCHYVTHNGITNKTNNLCNCPEDLRGVKSPKDRVGYDTLKQPVHFTTYVTPKKVEDFLKNRDAKKPFCLAVYTKGPHAPFADYPIEMADWYTNTNVKTPVTANMTDAKQVADFLYPMLGRVTGLNQAKNPKVLQEFMKVYYRHVSAIDVMLKKVQNLLQKYQVDDNTIIIFGSDNGYFFAEKGFSEKWLMYEPSIRIPALIYDPRKPVAQRKTEQVLNIDFAPTMLEYAGISVPNVYQGISLKPLVDNVNTKWRQYWYYQMPFTSKGKIVPSNGLRSNQYKYINYYQHNTEEFYDLQADPHELTNLIDNVAYHRQINMMKNKFKQYERNINAGMKAT